MRKPPPPHPKGSPRTPGSGRKKGTPNRKTVAMREFMAALLNDIAYQDKLRDDFRKRRVHPSIEALVWAYVVGKPTEKIEMSANVTMEKKLAEEREVFSRLSLEQLEELAAQSQALVDMAMAMANGSHVATRRRSPSLTPVTHPPYAVQAAALPAQGTAVEAGMASTLAGSAVRVTPRSPRERGRVATRQAGVTATIRCSTTIP